MHIFPDNEIDSEDKKKLEENIENIKIFEIFDDNLYKHGIYYNTNTNINNLVIYYYIGNIKTKEMKFNIFEYFMYLFNSESLMKILRDNNYIAMYSTLETGGEYTLDNNTFFGVNMVLTENGLNNINDILLIINKYINIMKKEGFETKYFDDFIKYMNNKDILSFNKKNAIGIESYINIFYNYHLFEYDNNILLSGKYLNNYNQQLLQELLITNLTLEGILNNIDEKELKYYNSNFIIGSIPDELESKINDNLTIIENLTIRNTSLYFSTNYSLPVIPCYKISEKECEEKNEFDINKDDKYNGTILDENDNNYITYYQIDKSSESHLVYSNLQFKINLDKTDNTQLLLKIEENYLKYILSEIMEISTTVSLEFNTQNTILNIIFKTFSDNTDIIINRLIDLLTEIPNEKKFKYSVLLTITALNKSKTVSFTSYIISIFQQFLTKEKPDDIDKIINSITSIKSDDFIKFHERFLNSINKINFKIAGNIDKELVEKIHNHTKSTIKINNNILLSQNDIKDDNTPFVKNYYQKSTMDDPENGIIVAYKFPQNLTLYFQIFVSCFHNIERNYLRFNYTNAYSPRVAIQNNFFIILEQGLFKEVDQMEDDINKVLFNTIINKTIEPKNFKEIIESYILNEKAKEEKTIDNLFEDFIKDENLNEVNINNLKNITNFSELIDQISDYFINPKRYTILIARKELSDEDFNKMFERRSKIEKYSLNKNITITHTTFIDDLIIIKKDNQFQKPNVKLNAEFELVRMENGMTGMIISDPYASEFHIQFTMKYGSYIDTIPGISHFGEHMVLQNCEKYNYLYPILNEFLGIKGSSANAGTGGTFQTYFIILPFNFLYEEAMDMLTESFRYPLFSPEIIKNEIQAVNHEFYSSINSAKGDDLIRQLSSNKTSFNGMSCGNNQTLKPSESELLSIQIKLLMKKKK